MDPPSLAAIRWKCRRGMLELDVLLERFVSRRYAGLSEAQRHDFLALLAAEDDLLWDWMTGRATPAEKGIAELVEQIRNQR